MQLGSVLHSCLVGGGCCRCAVPERRFDVIGTGGKPAIIGDLLGRQGFSRSFLPPVFCLAKETGRQDRVGLPVVGQFGSDEDPLANSSSPARHGGCRSDKQANSDEQKGICGLEL